MIALTLNHILYCIVCWTLSFYFSLSLFKDLHFNYIYLYSYFSTLRIWGSLRRLGCLLYHNKNFAAWLWRITNSNVILAVLIRYVYNMFQLEQTPFNRIPHLSQIPERDMTTHIFQSFKRIWFKLSLSAGDVIHVSVGSRLSGVLCALLLTPAHPHITSWANSGRHGALCIPCSEFMDHLDTNISD